MDKKKREARKEKQENAAAQRGRGATNRKKVRPKRGKSRAAVPFTTAILFYFDMLTSLTPFSVQINPPS